MPKRKHSPPTRSFRPEADGLETRQMLSGVVSGTDIDGDTWTLRLIGPGSLNVLKQNDANGNPSPLNSQTEINTITVGGTNPLTSRLVGSVNTASGGNGQVFFQNLVELPAHSDKFPGAGLGLLAIDMPGFYLGNTTTTPSTSSTPTPAPAITIPDGVSTLDFGGVDMTHNLAAPTSTTTAILADVQLGLPIFGGTRIIINKSVTTNQTIPASGSTPSSKVQDGVVFAVSGRLNLFQANEIDGDATLPPIQFSGINSAAVGTGGTMIDDSDPGVQGVGGFAATQQYFTSSAIKGAAGGQIGFVRIGGNATNLTTIVADPSGAGIDHISNFSVGGETNNIMLVAPNGARNVVFGKGMDTTEIFAHVINTLKANRGALTSNVYVDHTISRAQFGGDVNKTNVLSGFNQNFSTILGDILGNPSNVFASAASAPPVPNSAQPFGGMQVLVAGDVTNSVFAASVQPFKGVFGDANQMVLPGGHISGKVEGTINNSTATPSAPKQAFFASQVTSFTGPVVPPSVPEEPFGGPQQPISAPGIHHVGKIPVTHPAVPTPPKTTTKK